MNDTSSTGADAERRTLWIVLILNAMIALAFLIAGVSGDSSALLANGLDNLSHRPTPSPTALARRGQIRLN